MNLKRALPYALLVLLTLAAVPLFFGSSRLEPYPILQVYRGPLKFSGESAFSDLVELTQKFQKRMVGSKTARTSADWVAAKFDEAGLDVTVQEFDIRFRDIYVKPADAPRLPIGRLTCKATGYNVIGVSPGSTDETIIIGAHRDTFNTDQGAEDNGSGTASLIELARILSSPPHRWTYVFVSFDAEEVGLRGSYQYAQGIDAEKARLMINLDMTGFKGSDSVWFYDFTTSKGSSPLWTYILARQMSREIWGRFTILNDTTVSSKSPVVNYWQARVKRTRGVVPTDSAPFIDRNVATVGILAGGEIGGRDGRKIHSFLDTIEQVSPETLEMTGRFVEKYVRSFELGAESWGQELPYLNSSAYLALPDALIPQSSFRGLAGLWSFVVAGLAIVTALHRSEYLKSFPRFIKGEAVVLGSVLALALCSSAFPLLLNTNFFRTHTITTAHAAWFLLNLTGIAAIIWWRQRRAGASQASLQESGAHQQLLLNWVYSLFFVLIMSLTNVFYAAEWMVFPLFAVARLNVSSQENRVLGGIAVVVWSLIHFIGSRAKMLDAVYYPMSLQDVAVGSVKTALWMLALVYILIVPGRVSSPEPESPLEGTATQKSS